MASTSTALDAERLAAAEPSQIIVTWRRFRRHRLALVGLVVLAILALSSFLAPWIAPYDPAYQQLSRTFEGASVQHLLGTDNLGRDILTRLMYAGRISMTIGIACTAISITVGALVGAVAGFFGGWVDTILMRIVDLMLSVPTFPLLLALSQMLSSILPSVTVIILVLSIFGWLGIARLVRGQILSLRGLDFVEATRALGSSNSRIIFRHMLPNSIAPITVAATLAVGDFILSEAALSFLGYGVRLPTPTWGNMLADVNDFFLTHPLLAFYPGVALLLTVVSINFIGDALRDALDPRLKR